MAENTVKDTNMTENQKPVGSTEDSMDAQKKFELEKARFLIETANRFRLIFLFVAFLILLFVMLGGKIWDDTTWFDGISKNVFGFLYVDLAFMLIATLIKFFFVAKYNRVVKKYK